MATETIQIVNELRNNPDQGLKSLFEQYADKFYGYTVANWGLDEDSAWNIIYDTLLKLIDVVNQYEFENLKHFENFLFKVFKNNLKQHYRKQKALKKQTELVSLEESLGSEEGLDKETLMIGNEILTKALEDPPSHQLEYNENLQILEVALEKLPNFEKELLLLRAQNFSYQQIADYLKVEDKQLKVKYHRAKKKLINSIVKLQATHNG